MTICLPTHQRKKTELTWYRRHLTDKGRTETMSLMSLTAVELAKKIKAGETDRRRGSQRRSGADQGKQKRVSTVM